MNARKLATTFMTAAAFTLPASGTAHASDSVTITVNATVTAVCKFFTASPVINIANAGTNIDPSNAATATGNVAVTYRCSNGTTPAFNVPGTATITCAACAGTPTMLPTITSTSGGVGTGMGAGKDKTLTVTGNILAAGFQDAVPGLYTGPLVVSVTP